METPPVVLRAEALADSLGLDRVYLPEDGALLHVLAARRGITRAAEIGTGAGVGAAWIVAALQPQTPFVGVELDPDLAVRAAGIFAADPHVAILTGPWQETLDPEAPFDFLVVGREVGDEADAAIGLLAPGGTVVLAGSRFTPVATPDACREAWLHHPLLTTAELWVTPERRALIAVRR